MVSIMEFPVRINQQQLSGTPQSRSRLSRQIVVPEGMLEAVVDSSSQRDRPAREFAREHYRPMLEAALRWLMENPISPTDQQHEEIYRKWQDEAHTQEAFGGKFTRFSYWEWQRRMFLAAAPTMIGEETVNQFCSRYRCMDDAVIEAFKRGKESK